MSEGRLARTRAAYVVPCVRHRWADFVHGRALMHSWRTGVVYTTLCVRCAAVPMDDPQTDAAPAICGRLGLGITANVIEAEEWDDCEPGCC